MIWRWMMAKWVWDERRSLLSTRLRAILKCDSHNRGIILVPASLKSRRCKELVEWEIPQRLSTLNKASTRVCLPTAMIRHSTLDESHFASYKQYLKWCCKFFTDTHCTRLFPRLLVTIYLLFPNPKCHVKKFLVSWNNEVTPERSPWKRNSYR